MNKKTGTIYFEKLWKKMFVHFKTFLVSGDPLDLHKFRVSVKKLKSLLVLIESGQQRGTLLKRFKTLQKVFKKAGEIRNAQINLQLSELYTIRDNEFIEHQHQVVLQGLTAFRTNSKQYKRKLQKCRKDITRHLRPLHRSTIRKFYASNLEHIKHFFEKPEFNEALHNCRKKIKFLLYNHDAAKRMLKEEVKLDTVYLEQLQEKIGNWHDNTLVIGLLSPAKLQEDSVVNRLESENAKLEQTIRDEAGNFGSKAVGPDPALQRSAINN